MILKQFRPLESNWNFSPRQCLEQDHQVRLRSPAAGVLLHCRTRRGPRMDRAGKSQLPAAHVHASVRVCATYTHTHTHTHTHIHKQIHAVSHVPPCWHPHWYHTLSTLSWLCFSQSLQAKDNFNYWWAAEQWKWGLHWLRRATIDFAHYVHENVSILCRSACPPPAVEDKEPVHCACLICVTEVVCAKIDVAFHSTVCGPCRGLLLLVCLSLLSPGRWELCVTGSQDLHQYRCWLCMLVLCRNSCFDFFLEQIEGLSTDIIKYLTSQELHIVRS